MVISKRKKAEVVETEVAEKHTLIIAEKPRSAEKLAQSLADGNIEKSKGGKASWFEFTRNGKKHIVVPAVGHLFSLRQVGKGWKYPIFDMEWAPIFEVSKSAGFAEDYYKNISNMAKGADDVIVACDYDVEGDVIAFNIIKFICSRETAKRMKFSTLTKQDLVESYDNQLKSMDMLQVEAGLARHQLDWLWGLNSTRALTLAYKAATNRFKILSSGRVQGPALAILSNKEKEIGAFVPRPFWEVGAEIDVNGAMILASYSNGRLWNKSEAEVLVGKEAELKELRKRRVRKKQPVPFDLTTLQTEAFRHFRFSPKQTVDIAQKLYEAGNISYPRTSSQKLPDKIGYREILEALKPIYGVLVKTLLKEKELKPREGEKSDPAHPAIYPTATAPDYHKLDVNGKRIYDLVARRFMATFAKTSLREENKAVFGINGKEYSCEGSLIIERGWLDYYTYSKSKEQELPEMKIGDKYKCNVKMEEKETSPPPRFTQASILKEMEKESIGTKATRAHILQTLYDRGYIDGSSISVTEVGEAVVKTLDKYCPSILSTELTRKFEERMELIKDGKESRNEIVAEARNVIREIMESFHQNEGVIGKELSEAVDETARRMAEIAPDKCGGMLKMIYTKKGRFIGCSNYPNCRTAYPLPRIGKIIKVGKDCVHGHPQLRIIRAGKRPWLMCIDPKCPTKQYDKKEPKEGPAPKTDGEAPAEA